MTQVPLLSVQGFTIADLALVAPGPGQFLEVGGATEGRLDIDALADYIAASTTIVVIANANGTAWRFGGGLQICKTAGVAQPVNFPYGSIFGTQNASTWTFPAPFASPPAAFGLVDGTSGRWFGFNSTASILNYTQFGPLNQSFSLPSQLIAIGEYTP